MTHVKVCGICNVEDALAAVAAGVSSIGLNFVQQTPRVIEPGSAREISRAVRHAKVLVVGVVADRSIEDMRALVEDAELGCLQLHGHEDAATVQAMLPHAYRAMRIGSEADVVAARAMPGEYLLVDAKVEGLLGGGGQTFDWNLVKDLARERKLTLAGGLRPDNVAAAIRAIQPFCVDVASGVEIDGNPRRKDHDKLRAFITNARCA